MRSTLGHLPKLARVVQRYYTNNANDHGGGPLVYGIKGGAIAVDNAVA